MLPDMPMVAMPLQSPAQDTGVLVMLAVKGTGGTTCAVSIEMQPFPLVTVAM
jgi:hypothetical protein